MRKLGVKKTVRRSIAVEIDKLTNSIEDASTGALLQTTLSKFSGREKNYRRREWVFDWKKEVRHHDREVFKLIADQFPDVIQGLISMSDRGDHIFLNLIETAGFNRGKDKLFKGVAGNLVAFACKQSLESGYRGVVSFISKTKLINHYRLTLGAEVIAGQRMAIGAHSASLLIRRYFGETQ